MDTKRLLTTMLIVGAVMLLWNQFFSSPAAKPAAAPPAAVVAHYAAAARPELLNYGLSKDTTPVVLGNAGKASKDKVSITVSPVGAGVDKVQLNVNDYAETVKRADPLTLLAAAPNAPRPFTTIGVFLTVDGKEYPFDDAYVWMTKKISDYEVDFILTLNIAKGEKPVAEVTKKYIVDPLTYDVRITHEVKSFSDKPISVRINQLGPTDLPRDDPQMDDRAYHAVPLHAAGKDSYVNPDNGFNMVHTELSTVPNGTRVIGPANDYTKNAVLWASAANRFFGVIVRPAAPAGSTAMFPLINGKQIPLVTHIAAMDVDRVSATTDNPVGALRLTGASLAVPPGGTVESPLAVFMGPKRRDVLGGAILTDAKGAITNEGTEDYYKAVYSYGSAIQLATGCYAWCTWVPVANAILGLLNVLVHYATFGNYGIAIIVLVIVVRALLHPLTRASQINMATMGKKMKDVAPLVEAAKKKYADNRQKQNEEMMRIYRENNVNPAGGILGCLPMLIQMPIWAALYSGLRTDIDLRHASFIPGWINDLSHPDTIYPTALPVIGHPLFHVPLLGDIYGLNLLPILLGIVFFFQMKVTQASQPKPADEQQAQMQKMSQYMIFLFPLFLYSAPSGLNLYIFASTLGGLVDTWLVRKTLKKRGILPATAENLPTHEQKNPLL